MSCRSALHGFEVPSQDRPRPAGARIRRTGLFAATLFLVLSCLPGCGAGDPPGDEKRPTGPYLGERPPGRVPAVFARGTISTAAHEHSSPTFSPDGREVYWSLWRRPDKGEPQVIMVSTLERDGWTSPRVAPFSGHDRDGGPVLTDDGKRLYFYSRRPVEGQPSTYNHLWFVDRTPGGWAEPKRVPFHQPASTPSLSSRGTLVFTGALGREANPTGIFIARRKGDAFEEPVPLGEGVNAPSLNWTPFLARDEGYLIFSSDRPGSRGEGDLYVVFRRADGSWSDPRALGPEVNTDAQERFPAVSPDGKYLSFTRSTPAGHDDVYWVDAAIIEERRRP